MILKKHKNTLRAIIQEFGLDPTLFSAQDGTIDKEKWFIIQLRNTLIRFAVRPYSTYFDWFEYRFSYYLQNFPLGSSSGAHNIQQLSDSFKAWLNDVVKPYLDEVIAPDLWQILENNRSEATREAETPDYSESFSEEEKIQLRLSINEFQLLIVKEFNPPKKELKAINNRLKHLSDAMDKHNKFDWKGIAISTVISIAVTLALNPEGTHQLIQLFKSVFSHIIYLLP